MTNPGGLNDAFLYNGLGQRTAKTDSTGQYALVSDGASPAAPVLADGGTVYTPGLSSRKNGYSEFRHGDLLGSLRFLTDANQNVVGDRLFSAFGATVASDGDPSTPFGWVGDGESQTDADTGLVLMGHRVYDSRLGRFLSQDPAGDGDNWYAYCGNDPVNETDPSGLSSFFDPSKAGMAMGAGPSAWGDYNSGSPGTYDFFSGGTYTHSETISAALNAAFTSTSGPMMGAGPAGMGGIRTLVYQGFTPQEAKKLTHILNVIDTTKRGHQLVNKVRKSSRKYRIIKNTINNAFGYSSTGTIQFHFGLDLWIYTVGGVAQMDDTRIIAHELGHMSGGQSDDGPGQMNNVNMNENPVVLELAHNNPDVLRTAYDAAPHP